MNSRIKQIFQIFLTFLKIGAFTFGGGYAMIPFIKKETVEKKHWINDEDILEIVAIAESTPGPVAVNASTFVGYKVAGFWGAFMGTLGVVLPSFVIIMFLSFIIRSFQNIRIVKYAFFGIRAGVLALIVRAAYLMYRQVDKNLLSHIVMVGAFICVAIFNLNILAVILGCAVIGIAGALIEKGRRTR